MYRIPIANQCLFQPLPLQKQLRAWAILALTSRVAKAWLSIQLVDADVSAALNNQYRGIDKATNVLSFPLQIPVKQALPVLGDLVVCPSIVWQEAQTQEKAYHDHFCHIILHGVLHLLGYDHVQATEAQVMEEIEIQLLAQLAIPNPYD